MPEPKYTSQGATFSPDRLYRYRLWRVWDAARPRCAFIMLNPSTADETVLDPTLRRCCAFAQAWNFGGFEVGNLFALRSTDPRALFTASDPVGPGNDQELVAIAREAKLVIAGWGTHGDFRFRDDDVRRLLAPICDLHALRFTQSGSPSHPLYLPATLQPGLWRARRAA